MNPEEKIEEQFGQEYDRFIENNSKARNLKPVDSGLAILLREAIEKGKLYMCDKDNSAVWKASNVVGWKNGLLILHDR